MNKGMAEDFGSALPMSTQLLRNSKDEEEKLLARYKVNEETTVTVEYDMASINKWANKETSLEDVLKFNPDATEKDIETFQQTRDDALNDFKNGSINYDTMRNQIYEAKMNLYNMEPVKENSDAAKNIVGEAPSPEILEAENDEPMKSVEDRSAGLADQASASSADQSAPSPEK